MAALDVDTVLVPVDGSEESMTAVEYAVAIADRYGARVHALYVLGEVLSRSIETGDVAPGAVSAQTERFLRDLRGMAYAEGVDLRSSIAFGFSPTRKTQHPGSVTLDCAEEVHADFIVVPRESEGTSPDVLEKAAEYVLLYASQPVLSV